MNVVTKSVDAAVKPIESEHPNGEFEVVLSTEALDRDGENLYIDEWKTPLPARIHIDGDHGRTLEKTVGSAVPRIEGGKLIGKGVYAGTEYAQMVRQLVNEGHIGQVSVTYGEKKSQKDSKPERELYNAAFVAIPANPEAVVLASKSAKIKADGGMGASGNNPDTKHDKMVQAIHDAACHLGAECMNAAEADPGTDEGANKSISVGNKSVKTEVHNWVGDVVRTLQETSSSKDAGSPQKADDKSPAEAATKAAAPAPAEVPAEAADKSTDHAATKADAAAKARAYAFLISKTTP